MTSIKQVTVEELDLPLKEPFEIALGTQHAASNLLVQVETETGTVGYGDASPLPPVTGETQGAALETVRSAADIAEGTDLLNYRALIGQIRNTFPGMVSALFALETAILDAYCRERSLPLAELFGGTPETVETDLTIPIVDPETARKRAREAVENGFSELKIKTGTTIGKDIERVEAIYDVAEDCELKIDANQGWTPSQTIQFVEQIRELGIELALIEQPVPKTDLSGLAQVRNKSAIPIAADEAVFTPNDAMQIVRREAADIINVKLGKSGLLAAADIVSIAEAADLELMIGCMLESAVGIHTSAHFVAGTGAFGYMDLDGNRLLAEDVQAMSEGPDISLTGPGHGITPDL